jgi:opacity protein-like surface antigen
MKQKIKIFILLLLSISISKVNAQIISSKSFYLNASAGLARSEDGIAFMVKNSASQWTPMLNVGVGYRLNKYVGIELNAATMLTELKADGTLVSNKEKAEITARHSNLVLSPVFYLPTGAKSEVFLRPGLGLLLSNSKIKSLSNPNFEKSNANVGYMVTLGYLRKLNNKMALSGQFDFSDSYGSADVWTGDVGLLTVGIKYSLNKQ